MHTRFRAVIAACALVIGAAAPAAAQESTATLGTFLFEQQVMVHGTDGALQPRTVPAHLTLEQKGDSVFGTWTIINPDRESKPTMLRGTLAGSKLTLRTGPQTARFQGMNGEQQITTYSTYVLSIDGDAITGTINTDAEGGVISVPSRSITGRRKP